MFPLYKIAEKQPYFLLLTELSIICPFFVKNLSKNKFSLAKSKTLYYYKDDIKTIILYRKKAILTQKEGLRTVILFQLIEDPRCCFHWRVSFIFFILTAAVFLVFLLTGNDKCFSSEKNKNPGNDAANTCH